MIFLLYAFSDTCNKDNLKVFNKIFFFWNKSYILFSLKFLLIIKVQNKHVKQWIMKQKLVKSKTIKRKVMVN